MDEGSYKEGLKLAKEAGYGENEIEIWAKGYAEGVENGHKDGWNYYGGQSIKPKGSSSLYDEGYIKGYECGKDLGFNDRRTYGWQ